MNQSNTSSTSSTSSTISNNLSDNVEEIKTFEEMNLREDVFRGITSYGWENPTPIQQKAIVPINTGKDIIVQAEAGNGKTGAFVVGALQCIDLTLNKPQVLILSPTKELTEQSYTVTNELGQHMEHEGSRLLVHMCCGGTSRRIDTENLRQGGHIVCGTPGRIKDLILRRILDITSLKQLIFDEADIMLSIGFKQDIYDIFKYSPVDVQSIIVSATIPPDCLDITNQFMREPIRILKKSQELSLEGINQFLIDVGEDKWKNETISDLYEHLRIQSAMIFCNTRATATSLEKYLKEQDHSVSVSHSDLSKDERKRVLDEYRQGHTRVLISTDLLGRGIDIVHVSLVINYDLPTNIDNYIHRIGRSGRYGRKGTAINLVTQRDMDYIRKIERTYNTEIREFTHDYKL